MEEVRYLKPRSLAEALALISEYGGAATVMAGGTDLLVRRKKGMALPANIIDLKNITGLDRIEKTEDGGLMIGALATIEALEHSGMVARGYEALAEGAHELATPTIRRAATLAGNLCNAAPSADTAPSLMALEATVSIIGTGTSRLVPVEDFFTGPGETVLSKHEIISAIYLPKRETRSASSYYKLKRYRGADLAIVGIAVSLAIDNGKLRNLRIAAGAVGPTVIRAKSAEQALEGKKPSPELIDGAALIAADEVRPITDVRGSKEYRREMVRVLTKRAIETAISRIE